MKILLETIDKLDNGLISSKRNKHLKENQHIDNEKEIDLLQRRFGKGDSKVNKLISKIYQLGFGLGRDYENHPEFDIGKLHDLQARYGNGNGNSRIDKIIEKSYANGYDHGCDVYEVEGDDSFAWGIQEGHKRNERLKESQSIKHSVEIEALQQEYSDGTDDVNALIVSVFNFGFDRGRDNQKIDMSEIYELQDDYGDGDKRGLRNHIIKQSFYAGYEHGCEDKYYS